MGKQFSKCNDFFSISRVASKNVSSTKPTLSVPRRDLNAITMGVNKAADLAAELVIPKENLSIHTDSMVCLHWFKKPAGELNFFISNRVKKIQEAQFQVFYTNTSTNPADFVSIVRPVHPI